MVFIPWRKIHTRQILQVKLKDTWSLFLWNIYGMVDVWIGYVRVLVCIICTTLLYRYFHIHVCINIYLEIHYLHVSQMHTFHTCRVVQAISCIVLIASDLMSIHCQVDYCKLTFIILRHCDMGIPILVPVICNTSLIHKEWTDWTNYGINSSDNVNLITGIIFQIISDVEFWNFQS